MRAPSQDPAPSVAGLCLLWVDQEAGGRNSGSNLRACLLWLRIAVGRRDGGKQRRAPGVVWPRWQARSSASGVVWPPIGTAGAGCGGLAGWRADLRRCGRRRAAQSEGLLPRQGSDTPQSCRVAPHRESARTVRPGHRCTLDTWCLPTCLPRHCRTLPSRESRLAAHPDFDSAAATAVSAERHSIDVPRQNVLTGSRRTGSTGHGPPRRARSFASSLPRARIDSHTPSQMTSELSLRVRRRLVVGGWPCPLAWWRPMGHPSRATTFLLSCSASRQGCGVVPLSPQAPPPRRDPARLRQLADPQMKVARMGGAFGAFRPE